MGEMDFDKSTQAKYWMYDEESLRECQEIACTSVEDGSITGTTNLSTRVRKTASGYHNETKGKQNGVGKNNVQRPSTLPVLSPGDQELLVHFHAHQIQRLIGPNAIFPELIRGSSVLSTAIMLFRRFYLSNSVIDFHPRNIAAASALLACKADCERRLPIDVLSHATWVVQLKAAHHAPQLQILCQEELRAVTVPEIEAAESALLQGCDYRLRCHHPYGAIKVLASDISNYLMNSAFEQQDWLVDGEEIVNGLPNGVMGDYSTAAASGENHPYLGLTTLCERALSVAQSALVYSDVNFLFPPGQIAFAALAVALDGYGYGAKLGGGMRDYLAMRFRNKSVQERSEFESQVGRIVSLWEDCSGVDLKLFAPSWHFGRVDNVAEDHASELRRVFHVASRLRTYKMMAVAKASTTGYVLPSAPVSPMQLIGYYHPYPYPFQQPYYQHYDLHQHREPSQHSTYFVPIHENGGSNCSGRSKRRRGDDDNCHCHYDQQPYHLYAPSSNFTQYNHSSNKVARVTPVMMDY